MACCSLAIVTVLAYYIALPIIVFKIFLKLTTGWDRSPTCLVGKTTIVTGANSGKQTFFYLIVNQLINITIKHNE